MHFCDAYFSCCLPCSIKPHHAQIEHLYFITYIRGEWHGGPQEPGLASRQSHNKRIQIFIDVGSAFSFDSMHIQTRTHVEVCTSDWIACVIQLSRWRAVGFLNNLDRDDRLVKRCSPNGNRRSGLKQLCRALNWDGVQLNKDSYRTPFWLWLQSVASKLSDTHQRIRASSQSGHDAPNNCCEWRVMYTWKQLHN